MFFFLNLDSFRAPVKIIIYLNYSSNFLFKRMFVIFRFIDAKISYEKKSFKIPFIYINSEFIKRNSIHLPKTYIFKNRKITITTHQTSVRHGNNSQRN